MYNANKSIYLLQNINIYFSLLKSRERMMMKVQKGMTKAAYFVQWYLYVLFGKSRCLLCMFHLGNFVEFSYLQVRLTNEVMLCCVKN